MRAALYDPYLDTLGGGERYIMTLSQILKSHGWEVNVGWNESGILKKLEARLGLDLSGINIVSDINKGRGYDLVFWLSDGSIPNLFGKKNILHFQVPFQDVGGRSLLNRLKLRKINSVVCNSKFTKRFIDKEYGVDSTVVYPPVDVEQFKPTRKGNTILSVGRFSQLLQAKRQDILVKVFKKMVDDGLRGWRLILAGGSDVGGRQFLDYLRRQAAGYPIEIIENPNFKILRELYSKARIFWSASGFGVDEEKQPERVEHFGIAVVEAMSAGCVPIVVSKGGYKEIVKDSVNGFLWEMQEELVSETNGLIQNSGLTQKLSMRAKKDSKNFSNARFEKEILVSL